MPHPVQLGLAGCFVVESFWEAESVKGFAIKLLLPVVAGML
jgi:hypothetical protein